MRQGGIVLSAFFDYYTPESIVDVGCGLGHWLRSAQDNFGIKDILGIDGNYVDESELLISKESFERHDLNNVLNLNRKFDLCITIEVAEHITKDNADQFVKTITSLSDTVLFSAAAPYQGGVGHFNENTPNYWTQKFIAEEFVCFDFMRDLLWENLEVNCIYPQNLLLFVRKNSASEEHFFKKGFKTSNRPILKYHPRFIELRLGGKKPSIFKRILNRMLPKTS